MMGCLAMTERRYTIPMRGYACNYLGACSRGSGEKYQGAFFHFVLMPKVPAPAENRGRK